MINLLSQYPTQVDPVVTEWPYGEPRNITAPGDGLGTPFEAAMLKDIIGLQQALLTLGGIVPSGTPDEVTACQQLQALIELSSGRAFTYNESGVANAYIAAVRTGLEGPASYFDGMLIRFTPGNDNTGVSTIDVAGLGVKSITRPDGTTPLSGGELVTTREIELKYNGVSFVMTSDIVTGTVDFGSVGGGGTDGSTVTVMHGMGTDDIDFGCSVQIPYGSDSVRISALMVDFDGATVFNVGSGGATPVIFTTPVTGGININVNNGAASAKNIIAKWWVRRRA